MDPVWALAIVVAVLAAILVLAIWRMLVLRQHVHALHEEVRAATSARQSQATRYGQISEQFAPWMADWPWDAKRFRFIGTPIDGIQFTDEGVVFVEIKSASSRLSGGQRQVRDQVKAGQVFWREFRVG